jgi:uncharacterized membrane protein YgcG
MMIGTIMREIAPRGAQSGTILRRLWGVSKVQRIRGLRVEELGIGIHTLDELRGSEAKMPETRILKGCGRSTPPTLSRCLFVAMVSSRPCPLDCRTMALLGPHHLRMSLCLPVTVWLKTPSMLLGTPAGHRWQHYRESISQTIASQHQRGGGSWEGEGGVAPGGGGAFGGGGT